MLSKHCPAGIAIDAIFRWMDGTNKPAHRFVVGGLMLAWYRLHVLTDRGCPDHRAHEVGWKVAPRPCRVRAQELIDKGDVAKGDFTPEEQDALEENVCCADTPVVVRLIHMARRDGFVSEENLAPFADEDLGDPDFDAEEVVNMVLSQIMAQDGDVDALFKLWRVGELAY